MKIKLLSIALITGLIALFLYNQSSIPLKDKLCNVIEKQDSICNEIYHVDLNNQIVFYRNDVGVMYANMDDKFSKITNIGGVIKLDSIREEPLQWNGSSNGEIDFSMIWGIADKSIKTIKIESEKNRRPVQIKINEDIWLWYEPFNKEDFFLPITIKALDENGKLVSET